jgi:hypothetical protein
MNKLKNRITQYGSASTSLACLSNKQLIQILADAKPMHEGICGNSALISINDMPIFIKQIPLTDLEKQPENFRSTANIFDLPLWYQYGIGSAGFGAWRELATHILTTNWVITAECPNFPILYHWRILPTNPTDVNIAEWGDMDKYSAYWENASTIRKRMEDLNNASTHITLFLEYIPQNLQEWLSAQIIKNDDTAASAIAFVNDNLKKTNGFMKKNNLIHFDSHFKNILTDGSLLYFSDFGLALSSKFELTAAEKKFFNLHKNYDECYASVNLLRCIIRILFGKEAWETRLCEFLDGKQGELPPAIALLIRHHAPIALAMDEFFQKLWKESKLSPYPATQLENILKKIAS